jgi:hypothetical protein
MKKTAKKASKKKVTVYRLSRGAPKRFSRTLREGAQF